MTYGGALMEQAQNMMIHHRNLVGFNWRYGPLETDEEFRRDRDRQLRLTLSHLEGTTLKIIRDNNRQLKLLFSMFHQELETRKYIFLMTGPVK